MGEPCFDELHDALDLGLGNEAPVHADPGGPFPAAGKACRPCLGGSQPRWASRIVRESVLDETWKDILAGRLALM